MQLLSPLGLEGWHECHTQKAALEVSVESRQHLLLLPISDLHGEVSGSAIINGLEFIFTVLISR
jgi:hypothetical protein